MLGQHMVQQESRTDYKTRPRGPRRHTPDAHPRNRKAGLVIHASIQQAHPWRSPEPFSACSCLQSGRVGTGGYMKVPEPGDLSGLRPLFGLFGLFSHLNPIELVIAWSQSSLGTPVWG